MSYVTDTDSTRLDIAQGKRQPGSGTNARQTNLTTTGVLPVSALGSGDALVTNFGAGGNITVTLPTAGPQFVGCRVAAVQIGANTITLAPAAGPRVVCVQNAATPTYAWVTAA